MLNVNRNNTIYDAVDVWNRTHSAEERLLDNQHNVAQLAKTIFVSHSQERGFCIQKLSYNNCLYSLFFRLVRWLHLGHQETILTGPQKDALIEFKRTLQTSSQRLVIGSTEEQNICNARLKVAFGPDFYDAYRAFTDSNVPKIVDLFPKVITIYNEAKSRQEQLRLSTPIPEKLENFIDLADLLLENSGHNKKKKYFEILKEVEEKVKSEGDNPENARKLERINKAKEVLKDFERLYADVLDRVPLDTLIFSGLSRRWPEKVLSNYFQDLGRFMTEKTGILTQHEKDLLNHARNKLFYAFILLVKDHQNAAISLHTALNSRDETVFSGGSQEHGVLYNLKQSDTGKWNLAIIDSLGKIARTYNSKRNGKLVKKTKDIVYAEIPTELLTVNFFEGLLNLRLTAEDMEEVYKYIDGALLKDGVQKIEGEERYMQKKQSCATKCVVEWLRIELGKDLFREFNAWVTQQLINKIKTDAENISDLARHLLFSAVDEDERTDEFFDKQLSILIQASEAVLQTRMSKAKRLTLTPAPLAQ